MGVGEYLFLYRVSLTYSISTCTSTCNSMGSQPGSVGSSKTERYSSVYSYSQGSLYHCHHLYEASWVIVMQRIHRHNIVLRPWTIFLPKMVSFFHSNRDIVLSFISSSTSQGDFPPLLVVRSVRFYLSKNMASFRLTYFAISWVSRKGLPASHSTIS